MVAMETAPGGESGPDAGREFSGGAVSLILHPDWSEGAD